VAHGNQDPLTPIALSAERIQRHLAKGIAPDEASRSVIRACAETIGNAVETVRALVDEFSVLARFSSFAPAARQPKQPGGERSHHVQWAIGGHPRQTDLSADLPSVMADPEAIKRAIANLVDNAAEAMQDAIVREIAISTSLVASATSSNWWFSDTGHGVSEK